MKKLFCVAMFLVCGMVCYGQSYNSLVGTTLALAADTAQGSTQGGYDVGFQHGYDGIGYQNSGGSEAYKADYHRGYFDGVSAKKDYNDGYQVGYSDKMDGKEFSFRGMGRDYAKGYKQGWIQASAIYASEYQRGYQAGNTDGKKGKIAVDFTNNEKLTKAYKKGYSEGYALGRG